MGCFRRSKIYNRYPGNIKEFGTVYCQADCAEFFRDLSSLHFIAGSQGGCLSDHLALLADRISPE